MRASVVLCLLALLSSPALQAEPWQPATLAQAEMRELQSRHTGRTYRLYLSRPQGEAPPQGYPICTIRSTPDKPVHCIVWAKELFKLLFGPN